VLSERSPPSRTKLPRSACPTCAERRGNHRVRFQSRPLNPPRALSIPPPQSTACAFNPAPRNPPRALSIPPPQSTACAFNPNPQQNGKTKPPASRSSRGVFLGVSSVDDHPKSGSSSFSLIGKRTANSLWSIPAKRRNARCTWPGFRRNPPPSTGANVLGSTLKGL